LSSTRRSLPARLFGPQGEDKCQDRGFPARTEQGGRISGMSSSTRPGRSASATRYSSTGEIWCEVIDNTTSRGRTVRFTCRGRFLQDHRRIGKMPLPYYIQAEPTDRDKESYQDGVRARRCAASPLDRRPPFTKRLLASLKRKGVRSSPSFFTSDSFVSAPSEVADSRSTRWIRVLRDPSDGACRGTDDRYPWECVCVRHEHVPRAGVERKRGTAT